MYPVNCPWVIFIGIVSMCYVCRDDKKFTGLNCVVPFLYFQLPLSFYAIDKDMLIGAGQAFPVMKSGFWIKTYICYIQGRDNFIFSTLFCQYLPGYYDGFLPFKAVFFSIGSNLHI